MTAGIRRLVIVILAFAGIVGGSPARADDPIVELTTRPGVTVRYLALVPRGPVAAVAVMLAGSEGSVGLPDRTGTDWTRGGSILVRSSPRFRDRAIVAAIVDLPSDHRRGLSLGFRGSAEHAADIAAIIADLRGRFGAVPVWLVAHSSASASATNVAARLPPPQGPDGMVVLSTISLPLRASGLRYADIRVPALLVHNSNDRCTPLPLAQELRGLLTRASRVELMIVDARAAPGAARCGRFAAHGFNGIEDDVVSRIAAWIGSR